MEAFTTSLVREKIIIADGTSGAEDAQQKEPVVIRSNRIFLKLGNAPTTEKVVVRAQNMPSTLRLAAKILNAYFEDGSILLRAKPCNWDAIWDEVQSDYEKKYNPENWASVYINGKSVFKTKTSPLVDVIEQCALLTIDNYDATMEVTEDALKRIGHTKKINHSSNVAANIHDNGDQIHCGIIHRADGKDTTFSILASGKNYRTRIVQTMGIVAAYLELFNLRHTIETLQAYVETHRNVANETIQMRAAGARQLAIRKATASYESIYEVKYRPDKPEL